MKTYIQKLETTIDTLRKTGEELRLKEQKVKGDLREIEFEEKNTNEKLSLYDLDKAQFSEEREELLSRKEELELALSGYQSENASLEKEISMLTERKNTQQTSKEIVSEEINDLKVNYAALTEQFNHAADKYKMILNNIEQNSERLVLLKEDLELLSSDMTDSTSVEQQLEEASKQKLHDKTETIALISSRREERMKLQTALEDIELETKELKRLHKGMIEGLKDD